MSTSDDPELAVTIASLAAPIATELGVEILEVKVKGQRGRRLVRITADAAELDADAGLDIDTIARLSRRVGDALDEHDPVVGGYTLEVTSPGADRPLQRPRDFARNVGRELRVRRTGDEERETELTGTLRAVTETEITLETSDDELVVPIGDVERAQVVLPW